MGNAKNPELVAASLRRLISRPACVLSFDADLVELLPDILAERHKVLDEAGIDNVPELVELFGLLGVQPSARRIAELPDLVRGSGARLDELITVMGKRKSSSRWITRMRDRDRRANWRSTSCTGFCICRATTIRRRRSGGRCAPRNVAC